MSKPKASVSGIDIADGSVVMTVKTVADIGTQTQKKFVQDGGKKGGEDEDESDEVDVRQLIVESEASEHEDTKGKTVVTSKDKPSVLTSWLKNSTHEKAKLYELMKACGIKDPANTDLDELLGKSFVATVGHTKSGRAKIKAFAALTKGQKAGKTFLPTKSVYLDESFDAEAFEGMPKYIIDKAVVSDEYAACEEKLKNKKGKKK